MSEKIIWLAQLPGIGPHWQHTLLEHFGSAEAIYSASVEELKAVTGLDRNKLSSIIEHRDLDSIKVLEDYCYRQRIGILTWDDEEYPESFKMNYDMPIVLYYRGRLPREAGYASMYGYGVVGARRCSPHGKQNAILATLEGADDKAPLISGMAKGIDAYALTAVIKSGGYPIAVLGSGVDICYPPEHEGLMDKLIKTGLVISEYPPGTPPLRYNFPRRNRIIAELSNPLIVIEAGKNSGALITARFAEKYGHEVIHYEAPDTATQTSGDGIERAD